MSQITPNADRTLTMVKSPSRRSLSFTLNVLTVFGWWPPDEYRDNNKIWGYRVFQIVAVGGCYVLYAMAEAMGMIVVWGDMEKVVEASFLLLTHIAQIPKAIIVFSRSARIKRLIDVFEDPLFNQKMPEHKYIEDKYTFIVKRDNRVFLSMAAATVFLWAIFPAFETSEGWQLPLKAWIPFNTTGYPNFQIAYTYQITAVFIDAFTNICIDTLAAGIMTLTSLQLEVLYHNLVRVDKPPPGVKGRTTALENLKYCIRHHQLIIDFVAEQNELFSYLFFGQFVVAVVVICISAFQLTLVPLSIEFISMVLYLACMLVEVLLYCYHGNEIYIRSVNLADALAECNWIDQNRDFKKTMIFMMERTKSPLKVNAGKFFTLSLVTFAAIVRSSYSYFAVLQQMHSEK